MKKKIVQLLKGKRTKSQIFNTYTLQLNIKSLACKKNPETPQDNQNR